MADKTQQEQDLSIEEILASIRQIISDDDEPAAAPKETVADKEPVAQDTKPVAPAAAPPVEEDDDILDLTQPVDEPVIAMQDQDEDRDIMDTVHEAPPIRDMEPVFHLPESRGSGQSDAHDGNEIFTDTAATATVGAFHKLAENLYIDRPYGAVRRPAVDALTLEDIVRDLLKPMLREWIDRNMPKLVERLVQDELARLARRARDDE